MHLHTYHINTDKAACAKRARQTAAVNSQLDLRRSWMATEPGNKCIFHGRHVRARRKQTVQKINVHQVLILTSKGYLKLDLKRAISENKQQIVLQMKQR